MIYHGMTPDPALSAGMFFTDNERMKLHLAKLRKGCRTQGLKFVCEYREKGNDIYIGTFDTVRECNEAWDAEQARRKALKPRIPTGKGYTEHQYLDGTIVYKSTISARSSQTKGKPKVYFLGKFKTKELAHAQYVEAINQINQGTFQEWQKKILKGKVINTKHKGA